MIIKIQEEKIVCFLLKNKWIRYTPIFKIQRHLEMDFSLQIKQTSLYTHQAFSTKLLRYEWRTVLTWYSRMIILPISHHQRGFTHLALMIASTKNYGRSLHCPTKTSVHQKNYMSKAANNMQKEQQEEESCIKDERGSPQHSSPSQPPKNKETTEERFLLKCWIIGKLQVLG